jgi:uncharacterized membrane protein HdeD (DUF308 family)
VKKQWWCFLALGIALVVFGTGALVAAPFVSLAATVVFGFLLIAGGVIQLISSFWAGKWSGFLLHVLIGVLYLITGYLIVDEPVVSLLNLTLILTMFLLISGLFRIFAALLIRFHDWGWVLVNGMITLLLGTMIYKHWPSSSLWVIGAFVGIDMIFNGWAWIMLGLHLRDHRHPTATTV